MRARIRPTLSTALVASLLLGGCTATPDGATPASPPADAGAPAAAPTVDVDGFTPASPAPPVPANGMDNQDDDDQVDASSAAPGDVIPSGDSITPAVAAKAELTAAAFVRAFTRKDVTGTGWADGYTAYLTPYSQTAYAGTAQSSVPGTRVTGSAALAEPGHEHHDISDHHRPDRCGHVPGAPARDQHGGLAGAARPPPRGHTVKAVAGFFAAPLILVAVLLLLIAGGSAGTSSASAAACGIASAPGASSTGELPASVGRWSGDQLRMAATLLDAAAKLGVNQQAQTVLIMTAMGESSL